ncbi:hypothetical protein ACHAXS_005195 [Conticribra weissflogii]
MSGSTIAVRSRDANKNHLHPSESISAVDIESLPSASNGSAYHRNLSEKEYFINENDRVPPANGNASDASNSNGNNDSTITKAGLYVLLLLAFQNAFKNILLRYVMRDHPQFLKSTAVMGIESVKLTLSLLYIFLVQRQSPKSVITFLRIDKKNTLLIVVPATLYCIQGTLEYVALANLDAAVFSVLVQTKLLATAGCAVLILRKRIKKVQLISLMLLTTGVMLCNIKRVGEGVSFSGGTVIHNDGEHGNEAVERRILAAAEGEGNLMEGEQVMQDEQDSLAEDPDAPDSMIGIFATLGISACSGLASVYTEKVIKAKRPEKEQTSTSQQYGLAYTQVQLAMVSLCIMGVYCIFIELDDIIEKGFFYEFNGAALLSVFVGAIGGLIVAGVLKYADAILKGYATAFSIVLTGIVSMILFDTHLNVLYFLGIGNVICSVFLYSAKDLDRLLC